MDIGKLKENIDTIDVVEELIALSHKVFAKSNDDVKNVIELFITKSYLMGKKNMVKTFDGDPT
jgi:DnaJ-class molecular chaperone